MVLVNDERNQLLKEVESMKTIMYEIDVQKKDLLVENKRLIAERDSVEDMKHRESDFLNALANEKDQIVTTMEAAQEALVHEVTNLKNSLLQEQEAHLKTTKDMSCEIETMNKKEKLLNMN